MVCRETMVQFTPADFAETFANDGMVVLENFVSMEEVHSMKEAFSKLLQEMEAQNLPKVCFSTENSKHHSEAYFIESGDKLRPFFEEGVFDSDKGTLNRPIAEAVNKVGHALHVLEPTFSSFSLGSKFRKLARDGLGMADPRIVQSMYILKPPGIGGSVTPHRDETYLRIEPEEDSKLVGVWMPLDSATEENGCLWYVPGSHKTRSPRKFVRTVDLSTGRVSTVYEGPEKECEDEDNLKWVPVPVEPGACVLIDGSVLHKSERNLSDRARHAYTFHVVDFKNGDAVWSPRNWLQLPAGAEFPKL